MTASTSPNQRIEALDIAKFIGLLLVCYGHVPDLWDMSNRWVYSVHVALFFIISGMFLKPSSTDWRREAKRLLVPFVVLNIFVWVVNTAITSFECHHLSFEDTKPKMILAGFFPIIASWFLPALFVMRVGFSWAISHLGAKTVAVDIIMLFAAYMLTSKFQGWTFLSIKALIVGAPFFLSGYFLRDFILGHMRFGILTALILVAVWSLTYFNDIPVIHHGHLGRYMFIGLTSAFAGTMLIIRLSTFIPIPHKAMMLINDSTILFLCLHMLIVGSFLRLQLPEWIVIDEDSCTIVGKIILTIATFAVSILLTLLLRRRMPWLLGITPKSQCGNQENAHSANFDKTPTQEG